MPTQQAAQNFNKFLFDMGILKLFRTILNTFELGWPNLRCHKVWELGATCSDDSEFWIENLGSTLLLVVVLGDIEKTEKDRWAVDWEVCNCGKT